MSLGKKSFFGMLSGGGSVALKTVLNILVIPLIIQKLGLDLFGLYLVLISCFEISTLLDFGFENALVALMGHHLENPSQRDQLQYLGTGHTFIAILSCLFAVGGIIALPFGLPYFHLDPVLSHTAYVGFIFILLEAGITLYSGYYRAVLLAHSNHQWANISDSIYSLLISVGALALLIQGGSLLDIMALRLGASVLRLMVILTQAYRAEPLLKQMWRFSFSLSHAKSLLQLSGHAMAINFSIIISHKIDDIVIARFLPISAVGIYEIVFRFLGLIIQVCIKLQEGIYPLFARMYSQQQTQQTRVLFLRASSFLNWVAVSGLSLILVYYPTLFHFFSAGEIEMQQTLPILALAVPCVWSGVLQMPANGYLFTSGKQKFVSWTSMTAAGANLVFSLIGVKLLGLPGVALGTLIPQLIQHQAGMIRETCRSLEISAPQYLKEVHGSVIFPLLLLLGWAQLWNLIFVNAVTGSLPRLISIAIIGGSGLILSTILWFISSASLWEREKFSLITQKLLTTYAIKLPAPFHKKIHALIWNNNLP